MKKIYVLQCSFGKLDSYTTWTGGVFDNLESLEKVKKELEDKVKIVKDLCPHKDIYPLMTKKQRREYDEYCLENEQYMEYNDSKIEEYHLNQSNFNYWEK